MLVLMTRVSLQLPISSKKDYDWRTKCDFKFFTAKLKYRAQQYSEEEIIKERKDLFQTDYLKRRDTA